MKEPVQCDQEQGSWMWTDGILVPPGSTPQGELGQVLPNPSEPWYSPLQSQAGCDTHTSYCMERAQQVASTQ